MHQANPDWHACSWSNLNESKSERTKTDRRTDGRTSRGWVFSKLKTYEIARLFVSFVCFELAYAWTAWKKIRKPWTRVPGLDHHRRAAAAQPSNQTERVFVCWTQKHVLFSVKRQSCTRTTRYNIHWVHGRKRACENKNCIWLLARNSPSLGALSLFLSLHSLFEKIGEKLMRR